MEREPAKESPKSPELTTHSFCAEYVAAEGRPPDVLERRLTKYKRGQKVTVPLR
jgi:hypothetical protein